MTVSIDHNEFSVSRIDTETWGIYRGEGEVFWLGLTVVEVQDGFEVTIEENGDDDWGPRLVKTGEREKAAQKAVDVLSMFPNRWSWQMRMKEWK